MAVTLVPFAADNYAYLLTWQTPAGRAAAVVDPGEAAPVQAALAAHGATLQAILLTHHHGDHIGGVAGLTRHWQNLTIYGHESETARLPATCWLHDQQAVALGPWQMHALHTPGHTTGALCYYLPELNAVFTGDTMFLAGCGRLFEGSPAQMQASLARLAALPPTTNVYCGHEYTLTNLRFAASQLPDDALIQARLTAVSALRQMGRPSVPGVLAAELTTNVFLRAGDQATRHATAQGPSATALEVFTELRHRKNHA